MERRRPSAEREAKARVDLPEPETPLSTVMALCGMTKSMFLRLWTRAPRTRISSMSPGMTLAGALGTAWSATGFSVGSVGMCLNQKLYLRVGRRANWRERPGFFGCGTIGLIAGF